MSDSCLIERKVHDVKRKAHDDYPSRQGQSAGMIDRFDPVVYSDQDKESPLSQTLIESYQENGFIVLDGLFSCSQLKAMREGLSRLRYNDSVIHSSETITELDSNEIRSIFKVHEISSLCANIASDPKLLSIAQYLLGDDVYIHQSRLNYKPGFKGREFYWHSDFETWHVEDGMPRMRCLSMSIALTDNTINNGPLMVIPKSHRCFVVCEGETPENHFESSLKRQEYGIPSQACLEELIEEGGIETLTCEAGSVIIFDCNTIHGSNSNITPHPRSNLFLVYNALSNQVGSPFSGQKPRPEYICSRDSIKPLAPDHSF